MKQIRVLHVLGGFVRGGLETWLVQVLRRIDRDRFKMDFLVHTEQPCAYDDEVRNLGGEIIPCLHPRKPLLYRRNFLRVLRDHGPYDVVHSHVHHFSGYVLRLAAKAGVPKLVAHSHNDTSREQREASVPRKLYFHIMKRWIARYATAGIAVSGKAASALFGAGWEKDSRWKILPCGINLDPFRESVDRESVRAEFGFASDDFVIGHVGSFTEQKNHVFLGKIASEVQKREPKVKLLLIGDGPLRQAIEKQVDRYGLGERTVFTGLRQDVPALMSGAMDVFLLPSFYEGAPLVLMESQAAGLPSVISDAITEELDVVEHLMVRLNLEQPAGIWAEAVLAVRNGATRISREEALELVEQSSFNIRTVLRKLVQMYVN